MPKGIPKLGSNKGWLQKGRTPWNKGIKIDRNKYPTLGHFKKHSEETRSKISLLQKGKNTGRKPMLGKKHSLEARNKISQSLLGNKRSLGFKHTEETKIKIRLANRAEKAYNWKGGTKPLKKLIRDCYKYRQWRSDVFTRDDYTCQNCCVRGSTTIHVDHYPKMFAEILHENNIKTLEQALLCEEFWNINNGRTLCETCHRKIGKKRLS